MLGFTQAGNRRLLFGIMLYSSTLWSRRLTRTATPDAANIAAVTRSTPPAPATVATQSLKVEVSSSTPSRA